MNDEMRPELKVWFPVFRVTTVSCNSKYKTGLIVSQLLLMNYHIYVLSILFSFCFEDLKGVQMKINAGKIRNNKVI